MDLNRRSLLKFFGTGASIVPLIGGEVVRGAEARLISEPQVEPVITAQSVGVLPPMDALFCQNGIRAFRTTVLMQDADGRTYTFRAQTFAIDIKSDAIPLYGRHYPYQVEFAKANTRCEWTMRGQCVVVDGVWYTITGEA